MIELEVDLFDAQIVYERKTKMKKYFLDDIARVVLIIAFLQLILSFLIVY